VKKIQKQKTRRLNCLRVKKLFKYQKILVLLFVALFVFDQNASGKSGDVIFSEIMYDPKGNDADREWIEIYNTSDEDINLVGWKFFEANVNHGLTLKAGNIILKSSEYAVIAEDAEEFLKEHENFSRTLFDSSFSLSNDGEYIALKNVDGIVVGEVAYSKAAGGSENGFSIELDKNVWKQSNKSGGTPGEKRIEDIIENENTSKVNENNSLIIINEIFPAPLKDSGLEEFVELYSLSDKLENLEGWYLKDRAEKICFLTGRIIDPVVSRFLILKNKTEENCTLALNDTKGEILELYNSDENLVSIVSYEGSAKKGLSYNFNGNKWGWSKFLTPGKENILNNEPYGKVKIDDDIFENVYAEFSVSTGDSDGDDVEVVWDFGDNHKSYKAKTRHKYKKKGKYNASVKISDGSEDVVHNLVVDVEEFPHPKVRIFAVNANPEGRDSDFETITVENKSKKKINLKGWSVATGWKKFVNHYIDEDVVIKKNSSIEITRRVSSFTLNNKKDKIELRYPDGKAAYSVKYKKEEGIDEGEIYEKIKGGWIWKNGKQKTIDVKKKDSNMNLSVAIDNQDTLLQVNQKNKGTEEIAQVEIKKPNKLVSINQQNVKIALLKSEPRTLAASENLRQIDGIYFFTPQAPDRKHYAIVFVKNIFSEINSTINKLLNF